MNTNKVLVSLLFSLTLFSLTSVAQESKKEMRKAPIDYRHDLRIGIGTPSPREFQAAAIFDHNDNKAIKTSSVNIYAYYGYRIIKGLKVTGTFSYYNDYRARISADESISTSDEFWADGSCPGRFSHYRITPAVQYEWFNRGIVTMYSDLGCTFDITHKYDEFEGEVYQNTTRLYIRPNVTPFGITVGKKLFGFAEVFSFGPRGLFNAGIGYRF